MSGESTSTSLARLYARSARLTGILRADGAQAFIVTVGLGMRWRVRRLRSRLLVEVRSLNELGEHVRQRLLNEAPSRGVAVAEPKVAVVVTSRDRAQLLGLALRSVQLQDFTDWECIVVDDGSLDDAVLVAQRFAAADPRFVVLSHDRVRGLSAARNSGIAATRAPLVCFLDDDDILLAGSLRSRFDTLKDQPPDVVGAYCDWIGIDPDDRLERHTPHRPPRSLHGIVFGDLAAGAPFISSSPMLRVSGFNTVGGFDEDLPRAEDFDMWLRLARAGYRFVYAPSVGIGYRRSPGSLVIGTPDVQAECMLRILRNADRESRADLDVLPNTDPRPLSVAGFEVGYAPQILNYLALLADSDLRRAVELGCRALSASFRRQIEPTRYVPSLTQGVGRRLGRRSPTEVADLQRRIRVLLELLATSTAPFQVSAWDRRDAERDRDRARRISVAHLALKAEASRHDGSVLLVAEAPYHVDELGPIHEVLVHRGIKARFMAAPRPLDTTQWAIGRFSDEILPFDIDLAGRAAGLVVLNDWGYARPLVEACSRAGVATFAKVEGVQDFADADTGRCRDSYRTAAIVLGQGENDFEALEDRQVRVVGSTRLERIWRSAPITPGSHGLVNLNFTYSVLLGERAGWLASVEQAVQDAGVDGLISRHPAERTVKSILPISTKPFRYEITRAGVLVSRFSTVPFEAMARGVPFVYHNPHGERTPAFAEPHGAFLVSRSSEELTDALMTALSWRDGYRDRAEKFFRRQVDIDDSRPSEVRAADVIVEAIAQAS